MTDPAAPRVDLVVGDTVGNLYLESELGRGAFGAVFLARDTLIGRPVALKVLLPREQGISEAEREAFLSEARVIASLPSTHIVTLYSVHEGAGGEWLIEMEFVDSGSLFDLVTQGDCVSADQAVPIIRGILTGLRDAHERGVLHRDIKPGNVLLGSDNLVKLADFGLALVAGVSILAGEVKGSLVGTPWYMAPDLFIGKEASVQTDLWATGILIHEMLMGELPYAHEKLPALIRAVLHNPPPPLRPDLQARFGGILAKCLAKQPEDRARSAAQLLANLDRIARRSTVVTLQPAGALGSGRLFGRTAEIGKIVATFQSVVATERAALISLVADAGAGKSALLEEASVVAKPFGVGWLPLAITPTSGLLRPLLAAARERVGPGGTDEALEDGLTGGSFGQALPVLRLMLQPGADLDVQGREQTLAAIEQLLRGIAGEFPLCLAVDDAHLLNEDDVTLLRDLTQRLASDRFLLLVARRPLPDGSASVGRPEGVQAVEAIELSAMSREDIFRLLEDRAEGAKVQPRIAERIARRSGGNPLLALELFRHLQMTKAIVSDGEVWHATAAWDERSLPAGLNELFARRLDSLDDDDRELLEAAAVDGVSFDGGTLAAVLEISRMKVLRRLQKLCRQGGLVTSTEQGYHFDHPMLRDLLYQQTAPELRQLLHATLAEHLEGEEGVESERLGTHWEQAGDLTRAQPHLIQAACHAAQRNEQRRAIELFDRSHILDDTPDLELIARHGSDFAAISGTLASVGREVDSEQVLTILNAAAERAEDATLAARVSVQRILRRHETGALDENDKSSLEVAVERLPRGRELGVTHHCLGLLARRRGDLESAERHALLADELFLELGMESQHAAQANTLGLLAEHRGDFARAEEYYAEAAQSYARLGENVNAAIATINSVNAAMTIGRLDGRRQILREAIGTIELEGARARAAMAATYLANLEYALGNVDEALDVAEGAVAAARPLDAPEQLAVCLLTAGTLLSAVGRIEMSRAYVDEAGVISERVGFETGIAHAAAARARLHAYTGDLAGAEHEILRALETNAAMGDSPEALALELLLLAPLGVGVAAWARMRALLEAATDLDEGVRVLLSRALAGALAFVDPKGPSADLHAAADTLSADSVGDLRAELRIVAHWMRAEAHRRDDDLEDAGRASNAARSAAALLGHVWLELGVLRYLDSIDPSSVRRDRRATLLRRLAAEIDDARLRETLQQAWSP